MSSTHLLTQMWNDTAPTLQCFYCRSQCSNTNRNRTQLCDYLFAEKQGYSKFGIYDGNANADGTFVYTGFKPALFMLKKSMALIGILFDNKRSDSSADNANDNIWLILLLLNKIVKCRFIVQWI